MLKKFLPTVFVAVCSLIFASAQNYSTDAALISDAGNVATVSCSGIGATKKEAIEMAKKSVLYTYLYNGIPGLNDDRPLLGSSPSEAADKSVREDILGTSRYANFIRSYSEERVVKTYNKNFQTFGKLEFYPAALKRHLENQGHLTSTQKVLDGEAIALPTIMVVPFCRLNETYDDVFLHKSDMRMAIAKVNEGFIKKGVETKDLLTMLGNAERYRLQVGGDRSLDDLLVANSGADVSVSVDINQDANAAGLRISMMMKAVEIATGNTLATVSEVSGRKRTTPDILCGVMAEYMIPDFLQQITARLTRKVATGQSVAVRFTIDPGSALDMDSEINNIMPLSDILTMWVKRHAKNGRYHMQGRTATFLAFTDIFIDNSMGNGMQSDINDFSVALYQYLKGLDLSITRTITGNSVDIVIQ